MSALLRDGLPQVPRRMARLAVDPRGYPVPWFVEYVNGKPDFRRIDTQKFLRAMNHSLCWICGTPLQRWKTFVMGPMCVLQRISAEPPSHAECAAFAAQACPFLCLPQAKRREAGLPQELLAGEEVMIEHNPGITSCWTTHAYSITRSASGVMFHVDDPSSHVWYARGAVTTDGTHIRQALADGALHLRGKVPDKEIDTMLATAAARLEPST